MVAISVTLVTGPMRDTMPSEVVGSSVAWPNAVLPAWTVMRLPSWPSSFKRPDLEDWEMPSTPTMAAMPMLMPRADRVARTLRLRSPRLPTRSRSRRDSLEAPLSASRRRIMDDPSVSGLDAPVHGGGHVVVVGDDQDGRALLVEFSQQFQDGRPGGAVEVAGGLVGHDQGGPTGQRPCDRTALLLAAGKLIRSVPLAVGEPDPVDGRLGQLAALGQLSASVEQSVGDVV